MILAFEIGAARRERGISQQQLAKTLGCARENISRLERGVGSVELLLTAAVAVGFRATGLARGGTLPEQLVNARVNRGWSAHELAGRSGVDVRTVQTIEAGRGTIASLAKILSVIAPDARRQTSTRAFWDYDRARSAEADARFTPAWLESAITAAFGAISLDPCSHRLSPVRAERRIYKEEDGLVQCWEGEGVVYVNPPFSDLSPWLRKAFDEFERGGIGRLIMLFPSSRLDQPVYREHVVRVATTLILPRRLTFGSPEQPQGRRHPTPFSVALLVFGATNAELSAFLEGCPALVLPSQTAGRYNFDR